MYGHEFEQAPGVGNWQGRLACFSPWGLKESDMTEWLNWWESRCLRHPCVKRGFPGGSYSKESACNAGDQGSSPGSGRLPGEGNGNSLQNSCLDNPMERGAWWATVHGVSKSWTWLSPWSHRESDIAEWLMKRWLNYLTRLNGTSGIISMKCRLGPEYKRLCISNHAVWI